MKQDVFDFYKKYKLIASFEDYKSVKSRCCRFCRRIEGEVTFSERTHVLPELLGQNNIISQDECDSCNRHFSDFESHLSIFIRPYITLLGIKGKRKIPKFQSRSVDRNEETRTTIKHTGNIVEVTLRDEITDYTLDKTNQTVELVFRQPPFVPLKVYKSLVKIALTLIPQSECYNNINTFNWLLDKESFLEDFGTTIFSTTLTKHKFANAFAEVYKAKRVATRTTERPQYILIIGFANQIFQIFLPPSSRNFKINTGKRKIELNVSSKMLQEIALSGTKQVIKAIDLSANQTIKVDHRILLTYEEIVNSTE